MAHIEDILKKPVAELKRRYLEDEASVPAGLLEALTLDPRVAARALAEQIRDRRAKNRSEGQRLRNLLRFELELWGQGFEHVAGVDEAGMAPLAGPVVAAAVILPKHYKLRGLDDSKKILEPEVREALAVRIKADALFWAVGRAEVSEIDTVNIYHAGLLAMRRAVEGLRAVPHFVLVDARKIPQCPSPQRGIIHGDELSMSIAAASIIAKTTRDALMAELDREYPGYDFHQHKGYPTPRHCERLKVLGACAIHRRSFGPVREVLGLPPLHAPPPPGATDSESPASLLARASPMDSSRPQARVRD